MVEFEPATYKVELRLNNQLIGDIRPIAQDLTWAKRRTKVGVDSISFTVDDHLFSIWCQERRTSLLEMLKPLALDCRIIRNGIPLVGGFLATMPAYQPVGASANLTLQFDGYFNYLAGVYIYPQPTTTATLNQFVNDWMTTAETRSTNAGKSYGFHPNVVNTFPQITQSFEDYKDIKSYITDRCDNTFGAGEFEFYVAPDRNWNLIADSTFGKSYVGEYAIQYPAQINVISAVTLSAAEANGFASCVIGIGNGNTSGTTSKDTAITSIKTNSDAVAEYGYYETTLSASSISVQETLDNNTATELANRSDMTWQPQIELSGRQIAPEPSDVLDGHIYSMSDGPKIWIGDTISIQNNTDITGMTSGNFRVDSLEVAVDANGAESIKPTLSAAGKSINTHSFAQEFVRMKRELLALRAAS